MNENEKLAHEVKTWRAEGGFTAETAARLLGIPKRTFEGVEQGRGFPYPVLLRLAMQSKALILNAASDDSSPVHQRQKPGGKI